MGLGYCNVGLMVIIVLTKKLKMDNILLKNQYSLAQTDSTKCSVQLMDVEYYTGIRNLYSSRTRAGHHSTIPLFHD